MQTIVGCDTEGFGRAGLSWNGDGLGWAALVHRFVGSWVALGFGCVTEVKEMKEVKEVKEVKEEEGRIRKKARKKAEVRKKGKGRREKRKARRAGPPLIHPNSRSPAPGGCIT